jgi:hypothetical protein
MFLNKEAKKREKEWRVPALPLSFYEAYHATPRFADNVSFLAVTTTIPTNLESLCSMYVLVVLVACELHQNAAVW